MVCWVHEVKNCAYATRLASLGLGRLAFADLLVTSKSQAGAAFALSHDKMEMYSVLYCTKIINSCASFASRGCLRPRLFSRRLTKLRNIVEGFVRGLRHHLTATRPKSIEVRGITNRRIVRGDAPVVHTRLLN